MDRFGLAHRITRKQDLLLDRLRDRRLNVRLGARLGVRSLYLELTPTRLNRASCRSARAALAGTTYSTRGRDARSCSPLRAVADTKTRYRPASALSDDHSRVAPGAASGNGGGPAFVSAEVSVTTQVASKDCCK